MYCLYSFWLNLICTKFHLVLTQFHFLNFHFTFIWNIKFLCRTHLSWSEANTCDMMNIQTLQITVKIPLHTRFFSHMCFNLKLSLRASRFPNSLSHFLHGTFDLFAGSALLTNMCCFTLFLNEIFFFTNFVFV